MWKKRDNVMVEIICGACGAGQCKPIEYFRQHSQLTCDVCANNISIDNKQFHAVIAEFGRTMARLREPYLN